MKDNLPSFVSTSKKISKLSWNKAGWWHVSPINWLLFRTKPKKKQKKNDNDNNWWMACLPVLAFVCNDLIWMVSDGMKLKKPGYPWTIFPIEILTNKYGGRLLRFLKYRLACLHGDVGQWADVEKVVVEPMVLCVRQTNVGKFHLLLFFLSGRIGQGRVKSAIFIHNSTIHGFETKRAETLDKKPHERNQCRGVSIVDVSNLPPF